MSTTNREDRTPTGRALSRRSFLKGLGIVGAAGAASAALPGCAASPSSKADAEKAAAPTDAATQRLLERGVAGASLPDAAPIAPVEPPETWDEEADVIVVGMSGGGLVAAGYLAEQGLTVIGIEKQSSVGGSCRHACSFVNPFGGAKSQLEAGFEGICKGDKKAGMRRYQSDCGYSVDDSLMSTMFDYGGEACDWVVEQPGMNLVCLGNRWHDKDVVEGKQNRVLGFTNPIDTLEKNARAAGAVIELNTAAETLVLDDGRVVGLRVSGQEGTKHLKASKGVIFLAGGIGMNKDLIKAYLPSAAEGAVQGGPMPYHTGETFRMGLGAGGDFSGYDSWCCWESGIDESIAGGDGQFWHYFWHGERQLFHNPWLIIDRTGTRQPYYALTREEYAPLNPGGGMGDLTNSTRWMSAVGHHVYNICDSKFPEEIFKKNTTPEATHDKCRIPLTDPSVLVDNAGLVSADWLSEVDDAVARGAVKKADTLDELAEMLLLDPDVVKDAVERYNELCAKGEDDELAFPYDPSWLSPLDTPPYYAAIIGGQIGKTLCGLRVNGDFQVIDEKGAAIPGLYAGYSTAGGFIGDGTAGGFWNGTMYGGVGSSLVTGYIAAKKLAELE